MNVSIRKRLLFSLLTLITVACVFTLSKNYFDTRTEIQDLMDAELAQSARVLLEISAHELYEQIAYNARDSESDGVSKHIDTQVHKYQQEIDFQIWTADGHLAVRSELAPTDALIDTDEVFGERVVNGQRWPPGGVEAYLVHGECIRCRTKIIRYGFKSGNPMSNATV